MKERQKIEASNKADTVTAAFDLEQVLLSPFGQTSAYYYSRRLQNHNFTVTEIDTMATFSYLWNEHECEKGSCEVATGVRRFIQAKSECGIKCFNFFSDRCGGQNANRMMFIMISDALNELDLTYIMLTFLVKGHSQNENDTAHSTIEGHYRNRTIFTPGQWETTIEQAFKKNECKVEVFTYSDIINYKSSVAFPAYSMVLADKCFTNETRVDNQGNDVPLKDQVPSKKGEWC